MKQSHEYWMQKAIEKAMLGIGKTSPNPCVGAVLVKKDKLIASGYHSSSGGDHAEVVAIKKAGKKAKGSTLYVSLEPCSTIGKTPACTKAIIDAGIKHVIYASKDPNPQNGSKAKRVLTSAGIKVQSGVLETQADEITRAFKTWIQKKRPYVTLKVAQSLDGKIATSTGESKWISSKESRQWVQQLRAKSDAVLVGSNTVLNDNPRLDVRIMRKSILKVIVDSRLKISPISRIFSTRGDVVIATTSRSSKEKRDKFSKKANVWVLPSKGGKVSLSALLRKLRDKGVVNLFVEGGGEVVASFIENKLVDECYWFIKPGFIGGDKSISSVRGKGIKRMNQMISLKNSHVAICGGDIVVNGRFS